jgi:AcrR family transcriptional regulator
MNAAKPYHHGNLRDALILAAAELIEESGSAEFSLSDAARRAGVSNAAPYRHFKDKEALLRAVSELGFYGLDVATRDVTDRYEYGSQACIVELGKSYIRYLSARPAFFDLMWGEEGRAARDAIGDSTEHLRNGGFWLFVNQVDAWLEKHGLTDSDPMDIAFKLWAMAVGICHLVINRNFERFAEDIDPYQILATSSDAFLRGLLSQP